MKKTIFRRFTINEILTSSFLLILIIISKQNIFTINMGFMRIGITYTFFIIAGLILHFTLGILTVILGDTLGLIFNGTIGLWHYAYFLIPITIFIITFLFRNLFRIKNYKIIVFFSLVIFTILSIILIYLIFTKDNFVKKSIVDEVNIDFTNKTLKISVWVTFILMSLYSIVITFFYAKYRTDKWKDYVVVNIIVSLVFIIFIWYYGPFAQILWLSDNFSKEYWQYFSVYQIPRILKTPIMLPIYNFIVISVYKVYKQIVKNNTMGW